MKIQDVDNGQAFDFGKTSQAYAKYRDIYPEALYEKLHDLGIGARGTDWLDLGTGTGVFPRKMARYGANIIGVDISGNQISEAVRLSEGMENIRYIVCSAEEMDFPENSFDSITACQCFWYFDPAVIVPKIRSMLRPGGIFLKVYMSYMKEEPIVRDSNSLVKEINGAWSGGSGALKDLTTHYFENPQTDTIQADIPFTRETWHGRMLTCRGVMASMSEDKISEFNQRHREMLEKKYPEAFTVRHKIFITWYRLQSYGKPY